MKLIELKQICEDKDKCPITIVETYMPQLIALVEKMGYALRKARLDMPGIDLWDDDKDKMPELFHTVQSIEQALTALKEFEDA